MFEKKLKPEDLEELRKREELVNSYMLVIQGLEFQKNIYIKNLLPKYGKDLNKNFSIDLKTGKITEVKEKKKDQTGQKVVSNN